jgi:DNA-binding MarR family transcriptional regulator
MSVGSSGSGKVPSRSRLNASIKSSLRELSLQLALLNQQVSAQVDLRQIDLNCLDLIVRHGPLSPTTLARAAGLHAATVTGILDRLERGGWLSRERDPSDRRAVVVRASRGRSAELTGLYAGMNSAMDELCSEYDPAQLQMLAEFLGRTAGAGRAATEQLND